MKSLTIQFPRFVLAAVVVAVASIAATAPAHAGCGVPYDRATYASCMAEPGNDGSYGWQAHCYGQAVSVGAHKYLMCLMSGGDNVVSALEFRSASDEPTIDAPSDELRVSPIDKEPPTEITA
jgi:hypothetical protein